MMFSARLTSFLVLLALLFLVTPSSSTKVRYDGHSLIRVNLGPSSRRMAAILQEYPSIDVWSQTPRSTDMLLSPELFSRITKRLQGNFEVVVEDIQTLIDAEIDPNRPMWTSHGPKSEFFEAFRTYDEFQQFLNELVAQYPTYLTRSVIGQTYEGRDIVSIRLTTGGTKPVAYIEATTHAREWLAPTTALFTLTTLLEGYALGDPTASRLVESLEWHFVIFLNADGYIYSWDGDRLWRKNRRRNEGSTFYGVDLNRNWGPNSTWCTSGSSTSPVSDTYCGTAPFSEPETASTSKAETALGIRMAGLLAFHTYGPLLLRPYQHTYDQPPEPYNTEVTRLGASMEAAINAVHGSRYESIQGSDLYPHSGGTIDWTYENFGVPAFTVELRGNSFIVPASDIVPCGEENWAGVVVFADYILSKF